VSFASPLFVRRNCSRLLRRFALGGAATALLLGASACASYTHKTEEALRRFENGEFEPAIAEFSNEHVVASPFLRGAECGTVELAAGEWDKAQQRLDQAAQVVRDLEERALLGPEQLAESLTALLVNEAAASYQGEGYERVQLHAALALTYMARGDLDGVYVEARRANKLLESEEALYEKKYKAGGLGHFVSAVCYELQHRYDEAFIDYKRMDEKGVGTELAGKALLRLATRLGYQDELPDLHERYGEAQEIPPDSASIVVIAGVGLGPYKVEQTIGFPTTHGVVQMSVPAFVMRPQVVTGLDLRVDAGEGLRTSVIESLSVVSQENLHDRMAWLALRTGIRAAAKLIATDALTEELRNQHGDDAAAVGWLVGSLLTIATERADTRAWLTLPDTWQAARMFVEPGEHDVELAAVGGETHALGRYHLDPGETMIVIVRTLGNRVYAYPIGGVRSDAPQSQTTPAPAAATGS
jgi:hypothetical protein